MIEMSSEEMAISNENEIVTDLSILLSIGNAYSQLICPNMIIWLIPRRNNLMVMSVKKAMSIINISILAYSIQWLMAICISSEKWRPIPISASSVSSIQWNIHLLKWKL